MKYKLDSEIAAALTTLAAQAGAVPAPERGDWKALRDQGHRHSPGAGVAGAIKSYAQSETPAVAAR